MAPILTTPAVPIWLALVALAPAVAWTILRGDRGAARPAATWLALFAAAAAIALSAAACFDGARAALAALLGWGLLAAARIDFAVGLLPDRLTAPLALAGLGAAAIATPDNVPAALGAALLGMTAGFASLALVALLYRRWRGRDGMGLGDAKLLGAAGAWLGAAALPLTVCLAASSALVAVLAARRLGWRLERDGAVPFGPFLCLAAWIVFLTRGDML